MLQKKRRRTFGSVFAIVALVLPIALYLISLKDKTLTFEVISHSRLVGNDVSADGLAIAIDDLTVERLSLYSLKIENSGYTPILPGDFERPISVVVNDTSTLYASRVKSTKPADLAIISTITGNALVIEPLNLEPGDYFEIDLYSSSVVAPTMNVGIAGGFRTDHTLSESDTRTKYLLRSTLLFVFAAFYGVFGRFLIARRGFLSIRPVRITNLIFMGACFFAMAGISRAIPETRVEPWFFITGLFVSIALGMAWGIFLARNYSDAPKSI